MEDAIVTGWIEGDGGGHAPGTARVHRKLWSTAFAVDQAHWLDVGAYQLIPPARESTPARSPLA